jgi:phage terminase large subunit
METVEQTETNQVQINFLEDYKDLFNESWRYIIYHGGRYSGKSYHVALALLLRGRSKKLRILCTREIQNTIKDSVHKLLKDLIDKYGMADYVVTNDSIVNTITKTEFIFKGLKRNVTEIKSLEGIDICWIEEAQSITNDSLDILTPTIRKEGSQIIITFNRMTELDPVYVKYCIRPPKNCLVKQLNYDVLEKVGLLTQTIKDEIEEDRLNHPEQYLFKWLGQPLSQLDNAIISRIDILQAMGQEVTDEGRIELGVDVARMGNDRTVLWKRKGLKTIDYRIYEKLRTTEVVDKIEEFIGYDKDTVMKIDDTGVGSGVTDTLIERNYQNVIPLNFGSNAMDKDKYNNLISEAWFYLADIMKDIELPEDKDLLMELSTRVWKMDNKGRRCVETKNDYKKRGYRSPDLADACILSYYMQVLAEPSIYFI